ncbi:MULTISPECIES: hypothetical protein [Borreliella]|uniref:hypothetical protein n=1 Tax=Borreliella TaxID=64895 RepID=UPI0034DFF180
MFLNQENRGYKGGDLAKVKVIVDKKKRGVLLVLQLWTLHLSLVGLGIESNAKNIGTLFTFL